MVLTGKARLSQIEWRYKSKQVCLNLRRRIACGIDRREGKFFQADGGDGCAMPAHQDDPMFAQCTRERSAFLRLGNDKTGVAEIVACVPKGHLFAERRS